MQTIVNLGTGGADLNGQNGSTTSADSNDALFLDWPGDNGGNYVYLPGAAGNYLSVPDEAALDITGDIDIRVKVALDDWTPAVLQTFLAKRSGTSAGIAYGLVINTDGTLAAFISNTGTSVVDSTTASKSTVATGVADGAAKWVRCTVDLDNGAGGHTYRYYLSDDNVTWSQLGSDVTVSGTVASIFDSASAVNVGAYASGTSGPAAGKVYRAQVLDGIDGTPVLDVDCSQITSGADTSFTALTGQTVTINRSTSGRKSVAVVSPVWLFGTDDYMEVADNALLDFDADESFTVLAVIRQWATNGNFRTIVGKFDNPAAVNIGYAAWLQVYPATGILIDDGPSPYMEVSTSTPGSLNVTGGIVDRNSNQMFGITHGVVDTGSPDDISSAGSLRNSQPLEIAKRSAAYMDMELLAVAVFRRALTASEITAISTYYQNKVA